MVVEIVGATLVGVAVAYVRSVVGHRRSWSVVVRSPVFWFSLLSGLVVLTALSLCTYIE
jgi:uncharacterized membrane protein